MSTKKEEKIILDQVYMLSCYSEEGDLVTRYAIPPIVLINSMTADLLDELIEQDIVAYSEDMNDSGFMWFVERV